MESDIWCKCSELPREFNPAVVLPHCDKCIGMRGELSCFPPLYITTLTFPIDSTLFPYTNASDKTSSAPAPPHRHAAIHTTEQPGSKHITFASSMSVERCACDIYERERETLHERPCTRDSGSQSANSPLARVPKCRPSVPCPVVGLWLNGSL
jgi:hypothetical protein